MQISLQTATRIRSLLYISLSKIDRLLGRQPGLISVLCFHSVKDDNWRFSVDVETIKTQLIWLQSNFNIITLSDLTDYLDGKTTLKGKNVVITFDDGYKDLLTIKDFCKTHNIYPTVFVIADPKNANQHELQSNRPFLSRTDMLSLHKSGWQIGCHSMTHADFSTIGSDQVANEVCHSKKVIENDLGMRISTIAYPKGNYTPGILKAVQESGYSLGLSMDDSFITRNTNRFAIPRIGVDRTHSFSEFRALTSPSCVRIRQFMKATFIGKLMG